MAIVSKEQLPAEPQNPYSKVAVQLIINPIFKAAEVTASALVQAWHYRTLGDGTIERMPQKAGAEPLVLQYPDVFQASALTPRESADLAAIAAAQEQVVTAIANLRTVLQANTDGSVPLATGLFAINAAIQEFVSASNL